MARPRDAALERQLATRRTASAQVWLTRPRPASAEARRHQVEALVSRVASITGLQPIQVDIESGESIASKTHTVLWIEAHRRSWRS
jgi:hypothetical protein